jgi:NAD(P)-dependent dehydrogenase (short-subunit alcohol dehydrogenase family)
MFDLKGKVALVAGGAGYFGTSICRGLASLGAQVAVADVNAEPLERIVGELMEKFPSLRFRGQCFNIAEEASIKQVVHDTLEHFGRLDILINATCHAIGKFVEELSGPEFDTSLHANVTGSFLLAREASQVMTEGGSMVFFSSMYGHVSPDPRIYYPPKKLNPNPIEYGVSKAGLEQMTRYLAVHWAGRKIRVNAVAPGPFPHGDTEQRWPEFIVKLAAKVPLGRIGKQDEVTGAVIYLASDEASYVTGQVLNVDGGWCIW